MLIKQHCLKSGQIIHITHLFINKKLLVITFLNVKYFEDNILLLINTLSAQLEPVATKICTKNAHL